VIIVLSDLHLGLRGSPTPASLAPLLDGATELVLNGDATEAATPVFAGAAADALAGLRDVASRAGTRLTAIAGNHDPDAGTLIERRAAGAVILTHGHAFHPTIAPWSPHASAVGAEFARAHADLAAHPEPERTLLAAQQAARLERRHDAAKQPMAELAWMAMRPWKCAEVIGFWRIFPELATRFLESFGTAQPVPRVVACGHSHRAGAWSIRGRLVLNTGSFTFPGTPHAVLLDGDEVVLVPLVRRAGEWRYLASARRSWTIGAIARATAPASTPVA
jgi:predicted phosphodiesterase